MKNKEKTLKSVKKLKIRKISESQEKSKRSMIMLIDEGRCFNIRKIELEVQNIYPSHQEHSKVFGNVFMDYSTIFLMYALS